MIQLICGYDPECQQHIYPDDWKFGGVSGEDPRVDDRYRPTIYTYFGDDASVHWVSMVPICDEEALDRFTWVRDNFGGNPHWVSAKRPDGKEELLPWTYDPVTDELTHS